MKNIKTVDGFDVMVSDVDFENLSRYKWRVSIEGKRRYAVTSKIPAKRMHRIVLGAKTGEVVDHINGNGLDNTRENLRICTDAQNQCNRGKTRSNTVGFKGVSWDKRRNKFHAQIQVNYKPIHLGHFDCPFKAAREYDEAALKHHGDFAFTNLKKPIAK